MKLFFVKPQIHQLNSFSDFAREFELGKDDLVFTNSFLHKPFMKALNLECSFIFKEKYGSGEPSNEMINKILADLSKINFKRVIAVGGGSIIDIAKLFVLKEAKNTLDLFERNVPIIKIKELIIIPTTCGTGSEVTNLSIVEIKEKNTKMGLASDELCADVTVLIPELLKSLPFRFFSTSSIDALIHAVESMVSPKANSYTEMFSKSAIELILKGYLKIIDKGIDYRNEIMEDFLIASNYAGIAFGNTGVGAVHALSYPVGGAYHVPHGEVNYQFFTKVFRTYDKINPNGKIQDVKSIISTILKLEANADVFAELDKVLNTLITKKKLREYGMKEEENELFTDSVIEKQQRLLANNYVPLSREDILNIFTDLY